MLRKLSQNPARFWNARVRIIRTTSELSEFCGIARTHDFVAVDTEFARERTYFPRLLLVQIAHPGDGESAVLVDVLAEALSLDPVFELFQDESVVKVLHSARQDLEIFHNLRGALPRPLFDTQVAAMACGYPEQVGYDTLAKEIAGANIDKSARMSDWSRRPLSKKQAEYALSDVTHLRRVYVELESRLRASNRREWVEEYFEELLNPDLYVHDPGEAWKRVRTKNRSPEFLSVVRELARYREETARKENVPRGRVFRDEAIVELASAKPGSRSQLGELRFLPGQCRRGDVADKILGAVKRGIECPKDKRPAAVAMERRPPANGDVLALLRVLLKAKAQEAGVAQIMIASSSELEQFAAGCGGGRLLTGWRREVFGDDALSLREGSMALRIADGAVTAVRVAR